MSLVQTEDRRFVRDTESRALLNTDQAALRQYRATRQKSQQHDQLSQDVHALKDQVASLTTLVHELVQTLQRR